MSPSPVSFGMPVVRDPAPHDRRRSSRSAPYPDGRDNKPLSKPLPLQLVYIDPVDMSALAPQPVSVRTSAGVRPFPRRCQRCRMVVPNHASHNKECTFAQVLFNPEVPRARLIEFKNQDIKLQAIGTVPMPIRDCRGGIIFVCTACPGMLKDQMRILANKASQLSLTSTRPSHFGSLFGWGWNRFGQKLMGTDALQYEAQRVTLTLTQEANLSVVLGSLNFHPTLSPCRGKANLYFSKNYSPRRKGNYHIRHLPPPAVAKILGVPSCLATCITCRGGKPLLPVHCPDDSHTITKPRCVQCEDCCLHLDELDSSITLLAQWQPNNTPLAQQCFMCLGDQAISISGGSVFAFHGGQLPHGLWSPASVGSSFDWYAAAMVEKRLINPRAALIVQPLEDGELEASRG